LRSCDVVRPQTPLTVTVTAVRATPFSSQLRRRHPFPYCLHLNPQLSLVSLPIYLTVPVDAVKSSDFVKAASLGEWRRHQTPLHFASHFFSFFFVFHFTNEDLQSYLPLLLYLISIFGQYLITHHSGGEGCGQAPAVDHVLPPPLHSDGLRRHRGAMRVL
jgi:hypothetical protein